MVWRRNSATLLRWTTILTTVLTQSSLLVTAKFVATPVWNFITLADWHGAEKFVMVDQTKSNSVVEGDINSLQAIKSNIGGELVLLPGDSQGGHWDTEEFIEKFQPGLTPQEAVIAAGQKCYTGMKDTFALGGYDSLLMAVGDHELGGNAWHAGSVHLEVMPQFRQAFTDAFAKNEDGSLKFDTTIKNTRSRPWGTVFETTSYAYIHKNVLFVTVDAFHNVDGTSFFNAELGIGGEGAVTCTVTGEHLDWFKNILAGGNELRKKGDIVHIFVQAHDPIVQPVRRINSSGQFMDFAENSEFWLAMREYEVDIYFAGEVHDNTVTVDPAPDSNLVQVVSRGNGFSNFLNVQVTDTTISIDNYNEIGPLPKHNGDYEWKGNLIIDKSIDGATDITSTGTLKAITTDDPILRFTFDEIVPLESRQVIGLRHGEDKTRLIGRWIDVRGTNCTQSMPNVGEFGQQYDAQVGRLDLVNTGVVVADGDVMGAPGKSGKFKWSTRVAVYGMGPHSGGTAISYSTWIKTSRCKNMVIMSYANVYANKRVDNRHQFTLALLSGVPAVYFSDKLILKATSVPKICKIKKWTHIAVTMPRNSCLASEVEIYVDAQKVEAALTVPEDDEFVFLTTRGRLSLGGWGHAGDIYNKDILGVYIGQMDEARVYTRSLAASEIFSTMGKRVFNKHKNRQCKRRKSNPVLAKNVKSPWLCRTQCVQKEECLGFETRLKGNGNYGCVHFGGSIPTKPRQQVVANASCYSVRT